MIGAENTLRQGEQVQTILRPKLSNYLWATFTITIVTAAIFVIAIINIAQLFPPFVLKNSPVTYYSGIWIIALLLALGFVRPNTWVRARSQTWTLTNYALLLENEDGMKERYAYADIEMSTFMLPWQVVFTTNTNAVVRMEFTSMTRKQKSELRDAIQASKGAAQ